MLDAGQSGSTESWKRERKRSSKEHLGCFSIITVKNRRKRQRRERACEREFIQDPESVGNRKAPRKIWKFGLSFHQQHKQKEDARPE